MTSLLTLLAESIERDCTHIHVSPASSTIYLERDGRRYVVIVQDITEGVADLDTRIGPPRRKETGK